MRTKFLLLLFILFSFAIAQTGCKKCQCCGLEYGTMTCIKGSDTVTLIFDNGITTYAVADSENYYQSMGYAVTANVGNDNMAPLGYSGLVCGRINIKEAEEAGQICFPVNQFGNCD